MSLTIPIGFNTRDVGEEAIREIQTIFWNNMLECRPTELSGKQFRILDGLLSFCRKMADEDYVSYVVTKVRQSSECYCGDADKQQADCACSSEHEVCKTERNGGNEHQR